jgi:hypothetical protein
MMFHKRILECHAEHPTITWIFWIIVWILVLIVLFKPGRIGGHGLIALHSYRSLGRHWRRSRQFPLR